MNQEAVDRFIEHHGVKGMHWGVRKAVGSRVETAKKNRKPSSESKKVKELSRRQPQALTNKQLKSINERKNLETQFRRHKGPNPFLQGKNVVKELLGIAGMITTGYAFVNSDAGRATISKGRALMASAAIKKSMSLPYEQLTLF
jgi:hypothetical protein